MEETSLSGSSSSWIQDAVKKGLILGAIHIIVFLLLYMIAPSKMTAFSYVAFIIVLNSVYLIYNGIEWRKENGGYLAYAPAFKYLFVVLMVNGLFYTIFSLVLVIVDPAFPEVMAQSQLDTSLYWAQRMGAPESTLDKIQEEFNMDDVVKRFSFVGLLQGFGVMIIIYAVVAAIFALFIRKQQPETF
jgi:hypothetical protein